MTLHQLAILRAVLEQGSFRKAAEVLNLSQPAVTAQIKALEEELGCTLIERRPGAGGVVPTQEGKVAYKAALKIFERVTWLKAQLERTRTATSKSEASIRVVCDIAIGLYALPRILESLPKYSSVTQIVVIPMPHAALSSLLPADGFDLAIVPREISTGRSRPDFTFSEPLTVAANPALADASPIRDWKQVPLVIPPQGSIVRRYLDGYFQSLGTKPNIVMQFHHPEVTKRLMRTSPLASITHRISVQEELEAGTFVELKPPQPLPPLIYKVVYTRSRPNEQVRSFCRLLRERLVEQVM
ncbi:MAG: LysR family transcriptional regulator [Moorellales bacterium]